MELKITRLSPEINMPEYKTKGAVAFDLPASQSVTIPPRGLALIPTGLVVKIPEDHMLMITARSSLAMKKGLMLGNGVGTIDQDYCGPNDELKIQVWNFTDAPVLVEKGERTAQAIIIRIAHCELIDSPISSEESRGGFGSTGS